MSLMRPKLQDGKAHGTYQAPTRGVVPGVSLNYPNSNRQRKLMAKVSNVATWSKTVGEVRLVKVGPRNPTMRDLLNPLVEKFNNRG